MGRKLRVLVVDDSAFMRSAVSRMLSSDERFDVVGQAADGNAAVKLAAELSPDVITMDFNMPGLNGADATRAILSARAVPIVMLSAHTKEGASATVEALAAGALDFVEKPAGEVSVNLSSIRDELTSKLVSAAGANVAPALAPPSLAASEPSSRPARAHKPMPAGLRVVVIASSTGGPAALVQLVPTLALERHAVLVVVQHLAAGFTGALAEQLAERAGFPIHEATDGEELRAGRGLVAPGGSHLLIERSGRVTLSSAEPVHGVRPAADVTLKSAALAYGPRTVGVVLTGMGRDGATGLAAVKAAGGRTIAQDRASSTVYGMPKAAAELGVVDDVLPLYRIGRAVSKLVSD
ncbi:MAG: chemotaxis response regulator protein-glutamate methylesterase [Polyangiaceae bacterium]|nr:chemotaxis response regulator protein-glutamate methylesterase [Polyangiaceae bacterium]